MENSPENPPNSSDEVDGVIASSLKKNNEKASIDVHQSSKEVVISKTKKYDLYYSMDYSFKGYMIIFAHSTFLLGEEKLRERNGEIDISRLQKTFSGIGFQVVAYRDYDSNDIRDVMRRVSSMDFEEYACLAVAVSSHGGTNTIEAHDGIYDPDDLLYNPVKRNESLLGKPKIFFISTCRGQRVDGGAILFAEVQTDSSLLEEFTIPVEADFLIVYATPLDVTTQNDLKDSNKEIFVAKQCELSEELVCSHNLNSGYISYSNQDVGSHFIKYLTETIEEHPKEELQHVITIANAKLSIDFTTYSKKPLFNNNKQCICFQSTLTRLIKF